MDERRRRDTLVRDANIRLCRLRFWSNYYGLGFYLKERRRPPQSIFMVESNSPAAASGLKMWDVVLTINDENVKDAEYDSVRRILKKISETKPAVVELLVVGQQPYRNLRNNDIHIERSMAKIMDVPLEMPEDYRHFHRYGPRRCSIELRTNERHFGFDLAPGNRSIGAYVQEIMLSSPADRAGLRRCDRIVKINDVHIDRRETKIIYEKLNAALKKRKVTLLVMDTETYRAYESDDLENNEEIDSDDDDDEGDVPQQRPMIFTLTANHDRRLSSTNESILLRNHSNGPPEYEECEADAYLYESPDEDDRDSYIESVEPSTTRRTSLEKNETEMNERSLDVQCESPMPCQSIKGYENTPLLPLLESVDGLQTLVPNIKRNALSAIDKFAQSSEGLSKDEWASIQLYTMEWKPNDQSLVVKLNHALRNDNRAQLMLFLPYLKLILTALSKLPSVQTTVWLGNRADLRKRYPVGKKFVFKGFNLCPQSDACFTNKDVKTLFNIRCQSGKSLPHGKETLLLPATQFQVVDHKTSDHHPLIIHLKEIQSQVIPAPPSPIDSDYSFILLENEELRNYLDKYKTDKSIYFADLPLSVSDLSLIINTIYLNKYWTLISIHRIVLSEVTVINLMQALQSNTKVVFLELKSCQLNDRSSSLIASALHSNQSLQKVDLTDNQITTVGAQSFANMLKINSTLRSLHLSSNPIGDSGVMALFAVLPQNEKLRSLHLDRTNCTHQAINPALETKLVILYLNENHLGDEGAVALSRFLEKNRKLVSLHLASNNITSVGAKEIARHLQQTDNPLAVLDMSNNPLQDAGVASIAQALTKNKVLFRLHLDAVELTANGLHEIIRVICLNEALQFLWLKKNAIDDDGMFALLEGMKFNHVLKEIYLNDNQLTSGCIAHVTNLMDNNEIPRRLHLHSVVKTDQNT